MIVRFSYTNYRGETAERVVCPVRIYFGLTEWRSEPQWYLEAVDLDRGARRDFAMNKISQWRPDANEQQNIDLAQRNAELLKIVESLVARVAAQSEILTKKAESP